MSIKSEIFYIIVKLLESEGCDDAAIILKRFIDSKKLLPKRINTLGVEFDNNFNYFESLHNIKPSLLIEYYQQLINLIHNHNRCSSFVGTLIGLHNKFNGFNISKQNGMLILKSLLSSLVFDQGRYGYIKSRRHKLDNLHNSFSVDYHILAHRSAIYCLDFDKRGDYVFTGSDDYTIKIWSLNRSGKSSGCCLRHTLRGHVAEIIELVISKDNHLLASIDSNCCLVMWCLKTGQPVVSVRGSRTNRVLSGLSFMNYPKIENSNSMSGMLAVTSFGGHLHLIPYKHTIHDNSTDTRTFHDHHRWHCCEVQLLSPIRFSSLPDNTRLSTYSITCMDISPGGLLLATGCSDQCIRLYSFLNPLKPELAAALSAHGESVNSVAFSHHGLKLATGSSNGGSCWLWKLQAGQWRSMVLQFRKRIKCRPCLLVWSAHDKYLIASMKNGIIYVYFGHSGQLATVIEGHESAIHTISPSPFDENVFATGGMDGRFQLWNISNLRKFQQSNFVNKSNDPADINNYSSNTNNYNNNNTTTTANINNNSNSNLNKPLLFYYRFPSLCTNLNSSEGLTWQFGNSSSDDQPVWPSVSQLRRVPAQHNYHHPNTTEEPMTVSNSLHGSSGMNSETYPNNNNTNVMSSIGGGTGSSNINQRSNRHPSHIKIQCITACCAIRNTEGIGFLTATKNGLLSLFRPVDDRDSQMMNQDDSDNNNTLPLIDEQFFHWELDTAQWKEVNSSVSITPNSNDESLQRYIEQTAHVLGSPPASQSASELPGSGGAGGQSIAPVHESNVLNHAASRPVYNAEQRIAHYKPPKSVLYEVLHAPSGVPFHRLPPAYLTNLRGFPHPSKRQLDVPGRTQLTRPLDLLPSVMLDEETGDDIVVDDLQFCQDVPTDYCPTPVQTNTTPIRGKHYLWCSAWLMDQNYLIKPLDSDELSFKNAEYIRLFDEEVSFYTSGGDSLLSFGDEFTCSRRDSDHSRTFVMQPVGNCFQSQNLDYQQKVCLISNSTAGDSNPDTETLSSLPETMSVLKSVLLVEGSMSAATQTCLAIHPCSSSGTLSQPGTSKHHHDYHHNHHLPVQSSSNSCKQLSIGGTAESSGNRTAGTMDDDSRIRMAKLRAATKTRAAFGFSGGNDADDDRRRRRRLDRIQRRTNQPDQSSNRQSIPNDHPSSSTSSNTPNHSAHNSCSSDSGSFFGASSPTTSSEDSEWSENIDVEIGWWNRQRRRRTRRATALNNNPDPIPEQIGDSPQNSNSSTDTDDDDASSNSRGNAGEAHDLNEASLSSNPAAESNSGLTCRRSVRQRERLHAARKHLKRVKRVEAENSKSKRRRSARFIRRFHSDADGEEGGDSASMDATCFSQPARDSNGVVENEIESSSGNVETHNLASIKSDDIEAKRERLKRRLIISMDYAVNTSSALPLSRIPSDGYFGVDVCERASSVPEDYPLLKPELNRNISIWSGPQFDWLSMLKPTASPVLPQLGDRLVYLTREHRNYVEKTWKSGKLPNLDGQKSHPKNSFTLPGLNVTPPSMELSKLPWELWPDIPLFLCGQVVQIQYHIVRIANSSSSVTMDSNQSQYKKRPSPNKSKTNRPGGAGGGRLLITPPSITTDSTNSNLTDSVPESIINGDTFVRLISVQLRLDRSEQQSYACLNEYGGCVERSQARFQHKPDYLTVTYHDVDGILDFLILRHLFDSAFKCDWKPGDVFICPVGNRWWRGCIIRPNAAEESLAEGHQTDSNQEQVASTSRLCCSTGCYLTGTHKALSYFVIWIDDDEGLTDPCLCDSYTTQLCPNAVHRQPRERKLINEELLNIWDMFRWYANKENSEQIDSKTGIYYHGGLSDNSFIQISAEQLLPVYGTSDQFWSDPGNQSPTAEFSINEHHFSLEMMQNLVDCMFKLMQFDLSESFLKSVDLACYPDYLFVNPYLIDLTLISNRLFNGFYRHWFSFVGEFEQLLINTERYNIPNSEIVRNARALYELGLFCAKPTVTVTDLENKHAALIGTSALLPTSSLFKMEIRNSSRCRSAYCTLSDADWLPSTLDLINELYSNRKSAQFRQINKDDSSTGFVDLNAIRARLESSLSDSPALHTESLNSNDSCHLLASSPSHYCPHKLILDFNSLVKRLKSDMDSGSVTSQKNLLWLKNWIRDALESHFHQLLERSRDKSSRKPYDQLPTQHQDCTSSRRTRQSKHVLLVVDKDENSSSSYSKSRKRKNVFLSGDDDNNNVSHRRNSRDQSTAAVDDKPRLRAKSARVLNQLHTNSFSEMHTTDHSSQFRRSVRRRKQTCFKQYYTDIHSSDENQSDRADAAGTNTTTATTTTTNGHSQSDDNGEHSWEQDSA